MEWKSLNIITVGVNIKVGQVVCIVLVIGFKLVAGAIASNAFTGVAIGVGFIFASLVYLEN